MKLRIVVIAILCTGLFCTFWGIGNQASAQSNKAAEPKITVLNPMGTPPPIQLKPMAQPLNTVDGKTIYFVNTGYIGSDNVLMEMMEWFKAHHPTTNVVYKRSRGGMTGRDDALWAEMGSRASP